MERGAYISGDQLHDMIVTGQVEPDGEPRSEAEKQIELVQRNLCLLARSFADVGFVPVLDWVVRNERDLRVYVRNLSGLALRVAVLAPDAETVTRRKPRAATRWAHLSGSLARELRTIGLWVDSSDLTVDETVDYVLANKALARFP
jgi:chloramphenicol 3-O-phosphotransferase